MHLMQSLVEPSSPAGSLQHCCVATTLLSLSSPEVGSDMRHCPDPATGVIGGTPCRSSPGKEVDVGAPQWVINPYEIAFCSMPSGKLCRLGR